MTKSNFRGLDPSIEIERLKRRIAALEIAETEREKAEDVQGIMYQISEAVHWVDNLEELYVSIHQSLKTILFAENFYISLFDEKTGKISFPYAVDENQDFFSKEPVEMPKSLTAWVVRNGESLLVDDKKYLELVESGAVEKYGSPPASWLGVPLTTRGKIIGAMATQSYTKDIIYQEKDVAIMTFVSGQVANAIERKSAQSALKESEQRYRKLIEEAADIVYMVNLDGVFTYANPATEKISGYTKEELKELHFYDLVAKPYRQAIKRFYVRQVMRKVRETKREFWIHHKNGKQYWIEQTVTLLMEDGKPVGLQAICRDNTEKKKAAIMNMVLVHSLQAQSDAVIITDPQGKIKQVNPAFSRITGYTQEDVNNLDLRKIQHLTIPDATIARMWEVIHKGETWTETVINRRKDGHHYHAIMTVSPIFDEERNTIGYVAVQRDITKEFEREQALRESEQTFRSLSASTPVGILQMDQDGAGTFSNIRFQEITGRDRQQTVGFQWMDAIHHDDRETLLETWKAEREKGIFERECRIQHVSGITRWVNFRCTAMRTNESQNLGYVATFEDITERIRDDQVRSILYEVATGVNLTEGMRDLFEFIHNSLSRVIDTTHFFIALIDEEKGVLTFPYDSDAHLEGKEIPPEKLQKTLTAYVLRTGKPLLAREEDIERLKDEGIIEIIGKPAANWLGVPLVSDNQTIGVIAMQSYTDTAHYREEDVEMVSFVSQQVANAIERKRAQEAKEQYTKDVEEARDRISEQARKLEKALNHIKQDMEAAARVQQSMLPDKPPEVPGFRFHAIFEACEEVAGDMYNIVQLDENHLGVYILDVSGHGVQAALLSVTLSRVLSIGDGEHGILRIKNENTNDFKITPPKEVAEILNKRFPISPLTSQYFTFLYGVLDIKKKEFTYTRAGHLGPILINSEGVNRLSGAMGPSIGILDDAVFYEDTIQLHKDDRLIIHTDGLDEALNSQSEEFSDERVLKYLEDHRNDRIDDLLNGLFDAVKDFRDLNEQHDDITMLGFRVLN